MHRIDGAGHLLNRFVSEDALNNRPPTEITPEWMNTVQEELVAVIEWAGLILNKADNAQLRKVLERKTVPAGMVGFFDGTQAPVGWLKANGAELSRSAYADLFEAIGTRSGAGDGSETFNLPDLRGEFLRAWDDGRGVDVSRVLGSWQEGTWLRTMLQEWSGSDISSGGPFNIGMAYAQADARIVSSLVNGPVPDGAKAPAGYPYNIATTDNVVTASPVIDTAPVNNWIRMRPQNIALLACIKY